MSGFISASELASFKVSFADAITDDGIDYGTGYYLTCLFNDGTRDYFGPFDYKEDALSIVTGSISN